MRIEKIQRIVESLPAHFELTYGKQTDWMLRIYQRREKGDCVIADVQDVDLEYVLCKGYSELCEWCIKNRGGY